MGRPTKLTPALEEHIVRAIRAGSYPEVAAQYAGLDRSTYYRWIERGEPEGTRPADRPHRLFRQAVERAKAAAEVREATLIGKAADTDWRAAAWLLARKHPARWGTKASSDPQGAERPVLALPDGTKLSLHDLTDAELDALARATERACESSRPHKKAGEARRTPTPSWSGRNASFGRCR